MKKISGKLGTFVGKKKIVLGYIGAVFIVLLFVSSACGAPVLQTSQTDHSLKSGGMNTKREVTVDPNICITKEKLPLLKIALQHIDEPDYKIFVTELINIIEKNGKATSDDFAQIVKYYHLSIDRIAAGHVHSIGYDGNVSWFPGLIRLRHLLFWPWGYGHTGPLLIGTWIFYGDQNHQAEYRINIGEWRTTPNKGLVLLGVGTLGSEWLGGPLIEFTAGGFFTLILVTEI